MGRRIRTVVPEADKLLITTWPNLHSRIQES